ncbi:hypothetical protein Tco_0828942 [Tanacetum coccineum]
MIDVVKNSTSYITFTISADVLEIFMQQFWYTIKNVPGTNSSEFMLANKKCLVDVEVFRKILDICPRVEGEDFTEVQDDDATLTFLIDIGYKGPLHKYTNMYVDHMHQPWRTLTAIINKCLSGKTEYGLAIPKMMLNDEIKQSEYYQMYIKYSKGLIPPKKSKGKGSQGKKAADDSHDTVDLSKESEPEPEPLKQKGIQNLTPKEQEAAVTMQAIKNSKKTLKSLPSTGSNEGTNTGSGDLDEPKGISSARADFNYEWGLEEDNEHSKDDQPKLDDEEKNDDNDADDEKDDINDAKIESDEEDIYKYKIHVHKGVDEEMKDVDTVEFGNDEGEMNVAEDADIEKIAEEKIDDMSAGNAMATDLQTKETTIVPLQTSSQSVSFGFGTQFLNLSSDVSLTGTLKDSADAEISSLMDVPIQHDTPQLQSPSTLRVPVSVIQETTILIPILEILTKTPVTTSPLPHPSISTLVCVQQTLSPILTPPITTEAPPITTAVSESNALNALQLRVAELEKEVSELKKSDISKEVLASLKSQVPQVVNDFIESRLGNILQNEFQKNTTDMMKQYNIKKEQAKKQKMPKYTIKSTDTSTLKDFDHKSSLYQTMHNNKTFNRNPANHALYHALMKALKLDEDAMDKGVADTVKYHKRQHDDDDDDDEKGHSAGSNQGKRTKRRRTIESESSKKQSTTKESPKGKAPSKGSKTGKSATAKAPVEEPIVKVVMDDMENTVNEDVVNDADQPQEDASPKTSKPYNDTWFIQPPRPPTFDPEWNTVHVIIDEPEQQWFNDLLAAKKEPFTFDSLMATPIDFTKFSLHGLKVEKLTREILLDGNNPEGDKCPFDFTKPFLLQGRPGHLTVATDYFFNNDLEFLKSSDPEKSYTTSITKTKAARYNLKGIEDMIPKQWSKFVVRYDKDAEHEEIVVRRADKQKYKFKEGEFVNLHLNDIKDMLLLAVQHKLFQLEGDQIVDFITAMRMFTRSLIIKRRVEDVQFGVESYQKKLNLIRPQKTYHGIEAKELFTLSVPPGVIYEDKNGKKRIMWAVELHKFLDGMLKFVHDELYHMVLDFKLNYNFGMPKRK